MPKKKFLALYMGSVSKAHVAPPDEKTMNDGKAAWGRWMSDHGDVIVDSGSPLGKTKRIAMDGITDIKNLVTGYVIVEAESHESAAKMFERHPHFAIFPGDSVEIMECLPMPGM
jgi:hypothetical protein